MRILTRYILSEVISHAAIGVAVFTFVLFTRDLGHILDLVVRNSAPLPSVAGNLHLHSAGGFYLHHPHGRAGGNSDRAEPPCRGQRNHRHAGQRHRRVDIPAGDFHFCRDRLGAGDVQCRVPRARIASRAGQARGPAQDFAGIFRSSAASFLRGLSQARALRAGRKDRARRRHLEGRIHRRHQQPGLAAHYPGPARHPGQRGAADAAPAPDQWVHARDRSELLPTITRFRLSTRPTCRFPSRRPTVATRNRCRRRRCSPGSCATRPAR